MRGAEHTKYLFGLSTVLIARCLFLKKKMESRFSICVKFTDELLYSGDAYRPVDALHPLVLFTTHIASAVGSSWLQLAPIPSSP